MQIKYMKLLALVMTLFLEKMFRESLLFTQLYQKRLLKKMKNFSIFAFFCTFPWLTGAIIGGEDVNDPKKFPWMVQIYTGNGGFCGGSIISKRAILTAAHCVKGPPAHKT